MEKGDSVVMLFSVAGITSEEECTVARISKNIVTLDNGFRFDVMTGKCVNDNKWGGAKRELWIP